MLFFLSGIAARDVAFSSGETARGFFFIGRGGMRCNFFVRRDVAVSSDGPGKM
jgi:hypothetical protein